MDDFSDFIDSYLITKSRILREIDEESAYVYYLSEAYNLPEFDLELRKPYHSPIRVTNADEKPSFSVFENTRINSQYDYKPKYLWKDSGSNTSGDIFKLVSLLYDLTLQEDIFKKISSDFGLSLYSNDSTIDLDRRTIRNIGKIIPKSESSIRVRSKPFTKEALDYWNKYGITLPILNRHLVTQVEYFWTQEDQQVPYTPKSMCFAYRINNKYKLYTPGALEFRFINNYLDDYVEGWDQLDWSKDTCIITKSKKDIMVLDSLGYTSCSPKSETTMIPENRMSYLLNHFKSIYILFDNDGKHNYEKYRELYSNIPLILVPIESGEKDISDYRAKYGEELTRQLLTKLINQ